MIQLQPLQCVKCSSRSDSKHYMSLYKHLVSKTCAEQGCVFQGYGNGDKAVNVPVPICISAKKSPKDFSHLSLVIQKVANGLLNDNSGYRLSSKHL